MASTGHEVYRLNLNQGRFLTPYDLQDNSPDEVTGVNCVDINPAHQLLAFGCENSGTVQLWDPRSRSRVGLLRLPISQLLPTGGSFLPGVDGLPTISITAISSRSDGLSYAFGTSTGHTLLYDIRSARPFATKDQGYGLPVKKVSWIDGGHNMAHEVLVLSADKKVIKLWDREKVRVLRPFSESVFSWPIKARGELCLNHSCQRLERCSPYSWQRSHRARQ